jgi:hypothetical protein
MLKFLIDQGALLEDHSQGDEVLIPAACAGHLEVVKIFMLSRKSEPKCPRWTRQDSFVLRSGVKGHQIQLGEWRRDGKVSS